MEANNPFNVKNAIQLPSKYLTVDSIKQCLIHPHLLNQVIWRDKKFFQRINNAQLIRQYIFKNLQLAIQHIFTNQQLLEKINQNEFQKDSVELLISTDQFALQKDLHLIISIKVNSKSDLNNHNKYYILSITAFSKDEKQFNEFKKQGYKSLQHPNQIPVHIIGESVDSFIDSLKLSKQ